MFSIFSFLVRYFFVFFVFGEVYKHLSYVVSGSVWNVCEFKIGFIFSVLNLKKRSSNFFEFFVAVYFRCCYQLKRKSWSISGNVLISFQFFLSEINNIREEKELASHFINSQAKKARKSKAAGSSLSCV